MKLLVLLSLLFIVYYVFVIYTFYRLHLNMCSCAKLEKFKKMWQFNTTVILACTFLLYNTYYVYKQLRSGLLGGGLLLNLQLLFIIGYGLSFFHDYALLNLFNIMKNEHCPCHEDYRHYLETMTYVKTSINAILFVLILSKLDNKIIKKSIKRQKK